MEAFLRIGDFTITVAQLHSPEIETGHIITCQDTFKIEGGLEIKQVLVASESEAIEILQDFLVLDGPQETGAFRRYFPEFAP